MLFSFSHEQNDRFYRQHVLFFCSLALICGVAFFIGAVPTRCFGHDIFFLLDNGWRVVNGQYPHVDYTSAWGPITFLIVGFGLKLSKLSVDGVGYGSAIFGLIIGLWGYTLCRYRLTTIPQILLSLYLAVLVISPYPLGVLFSYSSHAMVYNRYGYALLGLIMVETFQTTGCRKKSGEFWGGISTGVATAISLFLKANYFFAAGILIGASLFIGRVNRHRNFGIITGFSIVIFAILAYLCFDISGVFKDLKMAAGARAMSLFSPIIYMKLLRSCSVFVILAVLIILMIKVEKALFGRRDCKLLFFALAVAAADLLLLLSNQQRSVLPLSIIFSLLLVNRGIVLHLKLSHIGAPALRTFYRLTIVLGGFIFLFFFALDISGIIYGAIQKAWPTNVQSIERFKEPRLAGLLLYDSPHEPLSNGRNYTKYVNNGISFLRKHTDEHETILNMDMFNPFPYSMGRRPARGGIAAAAYNYTLSDKHHHTYHRYFGNVDVVIIPKQPASPYIFYDGFYKIYQSALHSYFRLAAESEMWYLYRRK